MFKCSEGTNPNYCYRKLMALKNFCIRMDKNNKFNFVQNIRVNKQERVFSKRTGKEVKSVKILASKCLQLWGFGTRMRGEGRGKNG